MIFINRYRKDENHEEIRPSDDWFCDAYDATEVAKIEKDNHEFDRNIYADNNRVRPAIEKLFYDKCAYCETKFLAAADWDVEHFRPKGRIAEREDHLGYYWLGYEWENLYLSCPHCNQKRKDKPRWGDPQTLPAGGKLDQFPLMDERTRAMSHNSDIYGEHTLLIDPCYDDPEWYFAYDPHGQIFSLGDNPYGEETIEIFHLKRRRLRDARRGIIKLTSEFVKKIKKAQSNGNDDAINDLEDLLQNFIADNSQYAGVARFVVNNAENFEGIDS